MAYGQNAPSCDPLIVGTWEWPPLHSLFSTDQPAHHVKMSSQLIFSGVTGRGDRGRGQSAPRDV